MEDLKLLFWGFKPKFCGGKSVQKSRDRIAKHYPIHDIFDSVTHLFLYIYDLYDWNRLAVFLDYIYPIEQFTLERHKHCKQNAQFLPQEYAAEGKIYDSSKYCVQYAAYIYFMSVLGVPKDLEIVQQFIPIVRSAHTYDAGYFIGIDRKNGILLLCIRGSSTMGDFLTDLDATPTELVRIKEAKYHVHKGIWKATLALSNRVTDTIIDEWKHLRATEGKEYKIYVTGHSLGAGVCSLLGLLWYYELSSDIQKHDTSTIKNHFRCYSFASPPVISDVGRDLILSDMIDKDTKECIITSIVHTIDIVTRLSVPVLNQCEHRVIEIRKHRKHFKNANFACEICEILSENNVDVTKLNKDQQQLIRNLHVVNYKDVTAEARRASRKFELHFAFHFNRESFAMMQESSDVVNNYIDTKQIPLYPCGLVILKVPHYCYNDKNGNKCQAYQQLEALMENTNLGSIGVIWMKKLYNDLLGFNDSKTQKLFKFNGANGISYDMFHSLVYNTGEALYAHLPGAYTNIFDVSLVNVFNLSSRNWVKRLPHKGDSFIVVIFRFFCSLLLVLFGFIREWLPLVPNET